MHVLTFSLEACMLYASQLDRLISLKCHFCVVTVQALDYYVEKRSMCNSKNSVKAFLDPGIHLNVTLAQELICLGE